MAMEKMVRAPNHKTATVALELITYSSDFCFRAGGADVAHKADLASTIKNSSRALEPVLLWQEEGNPEEETLVLLDGLHRVEAYRAVDWPHPIPAVIVTCDRRTALRVALSGNSRRTLQLTQAERMDAAWRLVREPVVPRYKVREIVAAADVSSRTVKYMRERQRVMQEEAIEVTGQWARDRFTYDSNDDPAGMMTDAQRKAETTKLAKDFRDLIDRRKHPERHILRDSQAVEEAIFEALGDKRMKDMFAYLYGTEEEADEWLSFTQGGHEFCTESVSEDLSDGEGEPEPEF